MHHPEGQITGALSSTELEHSTVRLLARGFAGDLADTVNTRASANGPRSSTCILHRRSRTGISHPYTQVCQVHDELLARMDHNEHIR